MNPEQKEKLQELLVEYGKRYGLYRHPPYQGLGDEVLTLDDVEDATGEDKKQIELEKVCLAIKEIQNRSIEDCRQELIKKLEEKAEHFSESLAKTQKEEIEYKNLLAVFEERFADLLPFDSEKGERKLEFPQNMMQSIKEELSRKLEQSTWYSGFISKLLIRNAAEQAAIKSNGGAVSLVLKYTEEEIEKLEIEKKNILERLENSKSVTEERKKFVTTFYDICARLES